MALVQILVVSGFVMLMIYGLISMLMFSARKQKQQTTLATLVELQYKVQKILKDPGAWQQTFNSLGNTASFACLKSGVACATGHLRIAELKDASGTLVVGNLPDWDVPNYLPSGSGGFNDHGIACSTFDGRPNQGNDDCPFSYKIVWEPICPGNCNAFVSPGFRITARLLYNPSNNFPKIPIQLGSPTNLLPLNVVNLNLIPTTPSAFINPAKMVSDVNAGKFDVTIWRTTTTHIPTFRAITTDDGRCNWTLLQPPAARRGWDTSNGAGGYDPFFLVNTSGGGNRKITFLRKGTYECDVMAVGYSVGTFQVRLARTSNSIGPNFPPDLGGSTSSAPAGVQSAVQFTTTFNVDNGDVNDLNANTDVEVRQQCEINATNSDLGLNGGSSILGSVTCSLLDGN